MAGSSPAVKAAGRNGPRAGTSAPGEADEAYGTIPVQRINSSVGTRVRAKLFTGAPEAG